MSHDMELTWAEYLMVDLFVVNEGKRNLIRIFLQRVPSPLPEQYAYQVGGGQFARPYDLNQRQWYSVKAEHMESMTDLLLSSISDDPCTTTFAVRDPETPNPICFLMLFPDDDRASAMLHMQEELNQHRKEGCANLQAFELPKETLSGLIRAPE